MQDSDKDYLPRDGRFERIIYMIVFLLLFAIAETLLWAIVIAQILWMLFKGQPNDHVAEFGARLGVWLKRVALYQSGTTDEKPFPWREID
ncbi:DUF4389 domain-containing protein [Poseidonocella sp. HB161398]|uniref:DUF4389 domain-containing protein n=1 Tax=Poseidonocella sp. HB161398 TaxID=2320855 RepID=UPI00110A0393|nr:DUF4389 domain-containing protein [Poseidonocella sp. HB161398]